MKKKLIFSLLICILSATFLVGCGKKSYDNNFDGVYSFVSDNVVGSSYVFYDEFGFYGSWVETKGYLGVHNNCVRVAISTDSYEDEEKTNREYSYSLYVEFDGSGSADYEYYGYVGSDMQYSKGEFKVGEYTSFPTDTILEPSSTNMSSQPTSSIKLMTTILKNYMHSKGFTLDSLGYILYP